MCRFSFFFVCLFFCLIFFLDFIFIFYYLQFELKMVRREEENHGGLSCDVVSSLLLNKFVVIIGDSSKFNLSNNYGIFLNTDLYLEWHNLLYS